MALATKVYLTNSTGNQRAYTCADGATIPINTILTLSDPNTATAVSATINLNGYVLAGVASMDKVANDGSVKISAWTDGDFKVTASGNIAAGASLKCIGNGIFVAVLQSYDILSGVICGKALETAANGETFLGRFKF